MVKFIIVVVSDTIYYKGGEDVSGELAKKIIEEKGYKVLEKKIIPNDYKLIYNTVLDSTEKADVIVVIGGTGPSPRDISIDVIKQMAWRELPGFGELFRYLSYKEIGARAIISRASLFIVNKAVVPVIPGSSEAVEMALKKILLETIDHLIDEVRRIHGEHKLKKKE